MLFNVAFLGYISDLNNCRMGTVKLNEIRPQFINYYYYAVGKECRYAYLFRP